MNYDSELVYVASLLHDLGLSRNMLADKRFEVDGADAASRFLHTHGYPKVKTGIVWMLLLFMAPLISAERREPEVRSCPLRLPMSMSWASYGRDLTSTDRRYDRALSRGSVSRRHYGGAAEVARKKPHTAIGTGLADIGRRLVPGLDIPNVCDILLRAPFETETCAIRSRGNCTDTISRRE